jgi:hypothetical protein
MDGGTSVFTSIANRDGEKLIVTFGGSIRIDNPYKHLESFLSELEDVISNSSFESIEFDFKELIFCNSNGFYIIMDITELIMDKIPGPIVVKRLQDDDWQQETLPILLNTDEPELNRRISFIDLSGI